MNSYSYKDQLNDLLRQTGVTQSLRDQVTATMIMKRTDDEWLWLLKHIRSQVKVEVLKHQRRFPDKYTQELLAAGIDHDYAPEIKT